MYYLSVVMAVVTLEPVDSLVDNGTVCGQSSGKLETVSGSTSSCKLYS